MVPGYLDATWASRDHALRRYISAQVSGSLSVLEVGCGVGANLAHVNCPEVAGVDVNSSAIRYARSVLPTNVEVRYAEASKLPFPDDQFHTVFTAGLLVCIGPDSLDLALAELTRVARERIILFEAGPPEREEVWNDGETTYWHRDYGARLHDLGLVVVTKNLPDEVSLGHMNTQVTAQMSSSTSTREGRGDNK